MIVTLIVASDLLSFFLLLTTCPSTYTVVTMTEGDVPRVWWWDLGVPFSTWVIFSLFFNPLGFGNAEDFAASYYKSLEKLFEANKGSFVAYKGRRIQWISVEPRQGMGRKISANIWTPRIGLLFLTFFLSFFVLRGKLIRLSILEYYDSHRYGHMLAVHFISCLIWILASASQTIKSFHLNHRMIGYIAILSSAIMCGSACHLTIFSWGEALKAQTSTVNHVLFHSFCNLHVASMTQLILGYAISAARARNGAKHALYMGMVNELLVLNFLPRLTTPIIRWLLPSLMDGSSAFTVACLLNWQIYLGYVQRLEDGTRRVITAMNMTSALFSLTALIGEWQLGFPMITSIAGPIVTFLIGMAIVESPLKHRVGPIQMIS